MRNVLDRAILQFEEMHEKYSVSATKKSTKSPSISPASGCRWSWRRRQGSAADLQGALPSPSSNAATVSNWKEKSTRLIRLITELKEYCDELSADGFRVLAIAYRDVPPQPAYSRDDERNLVSDGLCRLPRSAQGFRGAGDLGTEDPRHRGQGSHRRQRAGHPQDLPRRSGFDRLRAARFAGGSHDGRPTGRGGGTDDGLRPALARPQGAGVRALQSKKHVVGFLGDGINDSPALRAADVGISVDTAVDIAKEAADMILLEKSLMVLEEGVLEGRKVFANILKYVRIGGQLEFRQYVQRAGASAILPFNPMLPKQLLTNNLLYDFSQVPIPGDNVDPEQIARPRPWQMGEIAKFILFIGPCSSIFDYTTYFMMLYVFGCWNWSTPACRSTVLLFFRPAGLSSPSSRKR